MEPEDGGDGWAGVGEEKIARTAGGLMTRNFGFRKVGDGGVG